MKIVGTILQVIGALAVLGLVLALGAAVVLAPKFMERKDWASADDIAPILTSSGLNAAQKLTVVRSYKSAWQANGNHRDFICAQVDDFKAAEGWTVGPETNPVMAAVRTLAAKRGEAAQCFGREVDGNAPEITAFIQVAQTYRREPDGAQIIFFDVKTKRLLYVDFHD